MRSARSFPLRPVIGGLLVVLVAAALVIAWRHGLSLQALQQARHTLAVHQAARPFLFGAMFFLVYVAYASAALPGIEILSLATGALFGLIEGSVLVSFGSTLGATLAMLASRFLFRGLVRRHAGARLTRIEKGMQRDGPYYLFSLRLIPAVPFFLINLLAGLTPIRMRTFWWVSQLGMLPATVVYVNAGTRLGKISSLRDLLSPMLIASLLLLAILPWLARAIVALVRRRQRNRPWSKPRHFDRNLVVIGAGASGLVSAYLAATLRAKVTLVEADRMGGECLNSGCVPSKAIIRMARVVHEIHQAVRFGVHVAPPHVDFPAVMRRVRETVAAVAPHDSEARYRELGVDVRRGHARTTSPWCVEVDGQPITTRAIVIATGAEPRIPELPGLREAGYLTSETLWKLEKLPERLLILGGGPIGCELSQAFARLGSKVTVIQRATRLLTREDDEVSAFVAERLREDGVDVRTGYDAVAVEADGDDRRLRCEHSGKTERFAFDKILIAVGRAPRTQGYGLEELGIPLTPRHTVETNAYLQTLYPNIFACGDVAGPWQLTHAGAHQAWYATVNALFGGIKRFRVDGRVMPAVTFTDPEVARVGLNEREAREHGIRYEVTRYDLAELDRALTEQAPQGFVKVLTVPGKDRILGATCVGPHAGEWIAEWVLVMRRRMGLNGVLATVHAYPTFAEANRYVAGAWKRGHAPERALGWLACWLRWRRHERPGHMQHSQPCQEEADS